MSMQRIEQLRHRMRELHPAGAGPDGDLHAPLSALLAEMDRLLDDLAETAASLVGGQARLAALHGAVRAALAVPQSVPTMLQQCAAALVQHLDAAFARIWLLDPATSTLLLQASAGQYTHLDGPHSRVPVGQFKIGRIAQSRRPHLTNAVPTDCEIGDPAWAVREGMVAFAGYPLLVDDRLVGVMALFTRAPLAADTLDTLAAIADGIAQGIERRRADVALQQAKLQLEQRVAERTAELATVNHHLRAVIAAHLQAETAVRFQAHLLDTVEQAVIATDLDGRVTYWNRCAETLYGWSAAEALGRNIIDLTPAATTQAQAAEIMARVAAGHSWSGEFAVRRRDGSTFVALVTDAPVYDEQGMLVGIVGVSSDITARKRAEEAAHFLAEASALLTASLDARDTLPSLARLAIPRIADWCRIDLLNADGALELVALAHADLSQEARLRSVRQQDPLDRERGTSIAHVLRTGQPELYPQVSDALLGALAGTDEHPSARSGLGITSLMLVPLSARGQTIGVISLGTAGSGRQFGPADLDLAQEVAARAALALENARLYREAQTAVRARDAFLSIAAHELKTPVTTVLGYSQALYRRVMREDSGSERDRRSLQIIAAQAERLGRLITTLFDVSRIESGHFSLSCAPCDLAALVRRVVDEAQPGLDRHSLDLVGGDEPLLVDGDVLRLEQVLQNVLGNAVKYSPGGGVITVRAEQRERQAVITVMDHGIGIAAAAQSQVFERFYRAVSESGGPEGGLGIGLYVVKELVTRHGGEVTIASAVGQGTTVTLSIPLLSTSGNGTEHGARSEAAW